MSRSSHPSLLMFVWLTIAYTVVHGAVASWGIMCWQAFFPSSQYVESVKISEDGEPLIQMISGIQRQKVAYRHFDGTVLPDGGKNDFAGPVYLPNLTKPAEAISWNSRISCFSDYQIPSTCWYLIAPPNRSSTAYFVGYDPLSRRLVGYISMIGFSSELPTIDESFPINSSYQASFANIMTASIQSPDVIEPHIGHDFEPDAEWTKKWVQQTGAQPDHVWILSNGNLYEIRLRERAVRKLIENRSDLHSLSPFSVDKDGTFIQKLIVKGESEMMIIDHRASGHTDTLKLDPLPANSYVFFYQLKNGQRLLTYDVGRSLGNLTWTSHIKWLDAEGHVDRVAEAKLSYKPPSPPFDIGLAAYLGIPSPLVAFGSWLATPFLPEFTMEANSTLGEFFHYLKLWLGLSLLTGIATGWACRRRERDCFGSSSWFWPIIVGACGWFGWMGYICLRPLPARLPRGQWLPAQPEPAQPLGTEIFA